eukprot:m.102397 g.102397  ORF g.102397 m.102397 type:complete len:51 (+) comp20805_c0_seq1:3874-4026(+)
MGPATPPSLVFQADDDVTIYSHTRTFDSIPSAETTYSVTTVYRCHPGHRG